MEQWWHRFFSVHINAAAWSVSYLTRQGVRHQPWFRHLDFIKVEREGIKQIFWTSSMEMQYCYQCLANTTMNVDCDRIVAASHWHLPHNSPQHDIIQTCHATINLGEKVPPVKYERDPGRNDVLGRGRGVIHEWHVEDLFV